MYGYSWTKEAFYVVKNSARREHKGQKFSWDLCGCFYLLSCKTVPCLPVGVWDVLPKEQFHPYSPSVLVTKPGIQEAFILMSQESLCIIWYSSVSVLKLCEKKKKKKQSFPLTRMYSLKSRGQRLLCGRSQHATRCCRRKHKHWLGYHLLLFLRSSRHKLHVGVSVNLMYMLPDVTCHTLTLLLPNFNELNWGCQT